MKYLIPALWALVWLLGFWFGQQHAVCALGYTGTSSLLTHFTYMFCHNGLLHLLFNAAAFVAAYALASRFGIVCRCLLWSFVAAAAATWLSMAPEPTVGGSGFVYAMFGYSFGHILYGLKTGRYALNPERIRVWFPAISTALMLVFPFFVPGINALLHWWCFVMCCLASIINDSIEYRV